MTLTDVQSWAYQLQGLENDGAVDALANSAYDLVVVDPTGSVKGNEDFDAGQMVAALHDSIGASGQPKQVIAYLDVGEAENFRGYWQDSWDHGARPGWIASEDPDGWSGNFPVKFWDPEWKDIVKQQVADVVHQGFDGAYFDWLEAYKHQPVADAAAAEGKDAKAELVKFVAEIADYAHSLNPNFVLIAQNAAEMGRDPEYLKLFNAVAQEHVLFNGSPTDPDSGKVPGDVAVAAGDTAATLSDLAVWKDAGKTVFNVEYATQADHVSQSYQLGHDKGFVTYVGEQLLDHLTTTPPPGLPDHGNDVHATEAAPCQIEMAIAGDHDAFTGDAHADSHVGILGATHTPMTDWHPGA